MYLPREGNSLPDVGNSADPRDCPLDTQPEAGMHEGPVLPEIEIPTVGLGIESLLPDPREQLLVIVLALGPSDDLSVSFRSQTVIVENGPRIVRVFLHVEGFYLLGIVVHED